MKTILWIMGAIILLSCSSQDDDLQPQNDNENQTEIANIPVAIANYQKATNSENIDQYMAIFTDNIVMIDVNRTFNGKAAVRPWAIREVMPIGDTFKLLRILEQENGYAKTEVKWSSWEAHYHFWWNENNEITKMSLQYKD
ncbi:nuclear transport factor 2 family protein [Prolixibacteraceae bacterium JC049]|nr:nuclear transport factor 2 family protein [Prolixibacteraceae bacterium JC049]